MAITTKQQRQQRLHQGAANAGVAVSIDSVGEPGARHADLLALLPLDHVVVSAAPFLHCQHRLPVSINVLAKKWCEVVGKLSVIPVVLTEVAGVARRFLGVNSLGLTALQWIYPRAPCPPV